MHLNIDVGAALKRTKSPGPEAKPAGPSPSSPSPSVKIGQPRVNLLPPQYRARAQERTMRHGAYASVVAAAVLVGGTWGLAAARNAQAQEALDVAQVVEQGLSADMAVYAPVTNLAAQTRALTDTIENQTALGVDHDALLDRFLAIASGRFDVASVNVDTLSASSCVSTNPFAEQASLVGCISFTGTPSDLPSLLSSLTSDEWFADPYVPSVGDGSSLSGTVGVTAAARTLAVKGPGPSGPDTTEPDVATTPAPPDSEAALESEQAEPRDGDQDR